MEALIFLRNNTHPDPVKDRRGCWKRGMVVAIKDDGAEWGARETLPDFCRVRVTGITVAQVLELLAEQREDDSGNSTPERFRRRRWTFDVDSLSPPLRTPLLTAGFVELTPQQARSAIKRIRDNGNWSGF